MMDMASSTTDPNSQAPTSSAMMVTSSGPAWGISLAGSLTFVRGNGPEPAVTRSSSSGGGGSRYCGHSKASSTPDTAGCTKHTILNERYETIKTVRTASHRLASCHEFNVLDGGKSVLIETPVAIPVDLSHWGGDRDQNWIVSSGFQGKYTPPPSSSCHIYIYFLLS